MATAPVAPAPPAITPRTGTGRLPRAAAADWASPSSRPSPRRTAARPPWNPPPATAPGSVSGSRLPHPQRPGRDRRPGYPWVNPRQPPRPAGRSRAGPAVIPAGPRPPRHAGPVTTRRAGRSRALRPGLGDRRVCGFLGRAGQVLEQVVHGERAVDDHAGQRRGERRDQRASNVDEEAAGEPGDGAAQRLRG